MFSPELWRFTSREFVVPFPPRSRDCYCVGSSIVNWFSRSSATEQQFILTGLAETHCRLMTRQMELDESIITHLSCISQPLFWLLFMFSTCLRFLFLVMSLCFTPFVVVWHYFSCLYPRFSSFYLCSGCLCRGYSRRRTEQRWVGIRLGRYHYFHTVIPFWRHTAVYGIWRYDSSYVLARAVTKA